MEIGNGAYTMSNIDREFKGRRINGKIKLNQKRSDGQMYE